MNKKQLATITQQSWQDVREEVKASQTELADIIDSLALDSTYRIYRIHYPYGAMILQDGVFQMPNRQGEVVPLFHHTHSSEVASDLNYHGAMPIGLMLNNSAEWFVNTGDQFIPVALQGKGEILGLWQAFNESKTPRIGSYWNIAAGARTICMLPKVTDKNSYRALKAKYGLKLPVPIHPAGHWHLFRYLANHENFSIPWSAEVIFFSKKWFEHKADKAWSAFYHFLARKAWESATFARNQFMINLMFSVVQKKKNLKPSPYLADTAKHLLAISASSIPALTIATNNCVAPVAELQRIFLEEYGLKRYAPLIMHTHHFSFSESRPVFYSLQLPTTMTFSPRANKASSAMAELRELKHILDVCLATIAKAKDEGQPSLLPLVNYTFVHTEPDYLNGIYCSKTLADKDGLLNREILQEGMYMLPEFSPLLRGCVVISKP